MSLFFPVKVSNKYLQKQFVSIKWIWLQAKGKLPSQKLKDA